MSVLSFGCFSLPFFIGDIGRPSEVGLGDSDGRELSREWEGLATLDMPPADSDAGVSPSQEEREPVMMDEPVREKAESLPSVL